MGLSLSKDRRMAVSSDRRPTRINEMHMREWHLPCDDCGHVGNVYATLRQIKRWIADEKLVCSDCGCIKQSFRSL